MANDVIDLKEVNGVYVADGDSVQPTPQRPSANAYKKPTHNIKPKYKVTPTADMRQVRPIKTQNHSPLNELMDGVGIGLSLIEFVAKRMR